MDGNTRNNDHKAQTFAEHLENIFQLRERQQVKDLLEGIVQETEIIRPTSIQEVIKNNISSKKTLDFELLTEVA